MTAPAGAPALCAWCGEPAHLFGGRIDSGAVCKVCVRQARRVVSAPRPACVGPCGPDPVGPCDTCEGRAWFRDLARDLGFVG